VPVRYRNIHGERLTSPFSFGVPDTAAAAARVLAGPRARDTSRDPRYAPASFIRLFAPGTRSRTVEPFVPTASVRTFLDGLSVTGLAPLSVAGSLERCAAQLRLMRGLLHPRGALRLRAAAALLRHLPGDRMLQWVTRERLVAGNPPAVLRNAVAAARYVGFDPRATLLVGATGGR
jgi:hypothetical protein